MRVVQVAERMTAEEFLAAGEFERGWPVSLVAGEVVMNDPSVFHGAVQKAIMIALEQWVRAGEGRGLVTYPIDVFVDGSNVYKPDVLWYSPERAPSMSDLAPYPMPDLAVEVRSPSTWRYDVGAKKAGYERSGLAELWLVDTTARAVVIFRRSRPAAPAFDVAVEVGGGDEITSPLLAGLRLPVAGIFPA